jgi:hypothetical protein
MKKIEAVIRKSKFDEVKEAQNRSQFLYLLGCYRWVIRKDMYIEESTAPQTFNVYFHCRF